MDKNLNNTLSRISYQLSNQQTASKFYSIKHSAGDYRSKMREAVATICNENSEIFAVFYSDNEVGEIVRNYLLWCGKGVK